MPAIKMIKRTFLFTLACCIVLGGCGGSDGPPSGVFRKIDVYSVLKSEFASTGDPIVERYPGTLYMKEVSRGVWRTDVNFTLTDGRDTFEKYQFTRVDEEVAIKSLRKHAENVLMDNGFKVGEVNQEQSELSIEYQKGTVTGLINFAASTNGKKMTLNYFIEERE